MLGTATYLNGDIEMLAPENGYLAQLVGAFSADSRSRSHAGAQPRGGLGDVTDLVVVVDGGDDAVEPVALEYGAFASHRKHLQAAGVAATAVRAASSASAAPEHTTVL